MTLIVWRTGGDYPDDLDEVFGPARPPILSPQPPAVAGDDPFAIFGGLDTVSAARSQSSGPAEDLLGNPGLHPLGKAFFSGSWLL